MPRPGIFLSCVSQEFHRLTDSPGDLWKESYRTQFAHHLEKCGQHVVHQETFAQGGGDLLTKLDDYIAHESKAVVHLIGRSAGWCFEDDLPFGPNTTSDAVHTILSKYGDKLLASRPKLRQELLKRSFRGISATQWEAYLAIHHQKPLLIFTFTQTAKRHPAFPDEVLSREDRLTQAEHFKLLKLTGLDRTEEVRDQNRFRTSLQRKQGVRFLRSRHSMEFSEGSPCLRCGLARCPILDREKYNRH